MVAGIDVGTAASMSPSEDGVGLSSMMSADFLVSDNQIKNNCNHKNLNSHHDVKFGSSDWCRCQ
jgi:hypothetical protein